MRPANIRISASGRTERKSPAYCRRSRIVQIDSQCQPVRRSPSPPFHPYLRSRETQNERTVVTRLATVCPQAEQRPVAADGCSSLTLRPVAHHSAAAAPRTSSGRCAAKSRVSVVRFKVEFFMRQARSVRQPPGYSATSFRTVRAGALLPCAPRTSCESPILLRNKSAVSPVNGFRPLTTGYFAAAA